MQLTDTKENTKERIINFLLRHARVGQQDCLTSLDTNREFEHPLDLKVRHQMAFCLSTQTRSERFRGEHFRQDTRLDTRLEITSDWTHELTSDWRLLPAGHATGQTTGQATWRSLRFEGSLCHVITGT